MMLYSISVTNKHRAIDWENGHNLLLPTGNPPPGSRDPKDSKAWQWAFYCSFEVEGVAIFVDNSQGEQLIQPSVVAFFRAFKLFTMPLLRLASRLRYYY